MSEPMSRDEWQLAAWAEMHRLREMDLAEGLIRWAEAAIADVIGGVRAWCSVNEIAEPPLDWVGLGMFLDRAALRGNA